MDEYPTDFVSIGTVENVYTTHVTHQEQFYIHLDTRSSILDDIMDKLETRYSQLGSNDKALPQIKLGGLCAAKFTDDNNWYRVKITGLLNNGLIEVNFVDYGNTDYVSADRVKKLDPDLMQYPVQSYKCALAGVSCQHDLWTPELRVQFEDLVVDKQCKAVFTGKSEEDIYLLDMYDEKGTHINKLFGATEKASIAAHPKANGNGNHTSQGFDTVEWKECQKVQAVVVYVTSPDVFWCQEVVHTNEILLLSEELSRLHMTQKMGPLQDIRPGAICAAKFHEDEAWYRGIIQSLSRNQAQVYFVDYGNTETVGIDSLCELKPQFRILPALAVKCSLCSLRTTDGNKWSPEATEEFEKLVVDKEFELCVLGKRHDGYDVSLLDIEENKDVSNQFKEIISHGGIKARTPPKVDNASNSGQATTKNRGLDLPVGSTSDVFLSWVDNPADFWVQLVKASDILDKLSSELQEYYSEPRPTALSPPGAFVIARFSEDKQWYRGLVVKEFDDNVKVLFIDYGNADTIPKSEVRQVNPQFGQIDPLAFRCSLKGIKPLPQDNSWSVDAKDFLEKLTENGCQCEVLSKNDAYRFVNLKVDGKDVTQELVSLAVVAGSQPSSVKLNAQSYLPSPRFHENQTEEVMVTHVDSPHSFWIQLNKSSSDLDAVMEKLDNHYSEEGGTAVARPAVGQACIAQYSLDNAWYRAVITNITPVGCNVHFVDYGNKEVVVPSHVCVAEPRFLDLPCQAIKCRLPLPGDVSSLTDVFSNLVLEKDVSLKVVAGGGVPTVDLLVDGQSVCSILRNGNSSNDARAQNESRSPEIKPATPIPQGSPVKAFTSMVHNPGKFFLQLSGVDEELSSLMDRLTEQYVPQGVPEVPHPSVGMFCVALYQDDNQWYRGKITSVHGDHCQVLFVDYGNEEFVDNGSVKVLTSEVSNSPILAYQCSLHGVHATEWSESSIEYFESLVMDQELSCIFTTPSTVKISCNGEDIGSKLVSAGHCQCIEETGLKSPQSASIQNGFGSVESPKSPRFGQTQRKEESGTAGFGGNKREEKRSFGGGKLNDSFGESREDKQGFGGGRQEARGFGGGGQEGRGFGGARRFGGGDDSGSHKSDEGSDRGGFKSRSRDEGDSGFGGKRGGGGDNGSGFGGGRRERNTDSSAVDKFIYADAPSEPENAILVHIDDDGTFYLQLPSMEKDIMFLSKRLAGSYKSGGPRLKGTAEKGTICCCKFPDDGNMYRCQVEGIDGNNVLVRYMDFGNTAEHSTFDLKFLFPDLLQYPVQAFPCKLRGFDWCLDTAGTFGTATLDKDLEVTFTNTTAPFLVDIKTPDGDLLSIMTGKIAPPAPQNSSPKGKASPSQTGGFGAKSPKGFGSKAVIDSSTPVKRSLNLASSPAEPAVPKQVFLPQTVPSDSNTAFISHISEDGHFYVQLDKDTDLLERLTQKLSNLNTTIPHPDLCKGAACAAIFSEDSSWYRAKVSEVNDNQFSVTFVDFGNGDVVSKENIRPLNGDLLSAAPLAYQCSFSGDDETLSENSKEKLEEFLLEHQITVSFCSQSAPFAISATTSDGQDLHEIVSPSNRFRSHVIPKDVTPVGVCHIEDDGRFFICFYQQYKAKDNLQKNLQVKYSSAEVESIESFEVDSPCCFKSPSDDLWHRGCVKSINESKTEVQYVDIGKIECIETESLKILDTGFLKEPPFSLECRLKGVESWTDDLKEKFISMTEDKILNATFYTMSLPYRVSLARSIELDLLGLNAPQPDSPRKTVDSTMVSNANMNRSSVFQGGDSYITEVTPQGIFFAQLVSEEEQLQSLSDSLESLMVTELIEPDTVEVGNMLFAKFTEDDVWYRAIVEKEDGDMFTVRFVDYGNTDTLCKDRLTSLPDEFSTISIPAFAYKCKLSTLMSQAEEFKAAVIDKVVSIQMVSIEDDGVFNVNVTLDGQPILMDRETTTLEENQEVNAKPDSIERATVTVSFVVDPSQFYVQLQAEEGKLDSMMSDLLVDIEGLKQGEGLVSKDLAMGDLCAALYDESWYRARVISFGIADQSVQVLYIDYGNEEMLSDPSELRVLPEKYKSLPLFGHEATLPGIKPVNEDWTDEAIEEFKMLVEEKSLLADLLDSSDDKPWVVQLLDMGTPVRDTLIAHGQGTATENVVISNSIKHVFSEANESSLDLEEGPACADDKTKKRKLGCISDTIEELAEVSVFVSHIDNPSELWCQLASSTEDLEKLAGRMERLYSTITDSDRVLGDIDTGDFVVGLFEDDGVRYRSLVIDTEVPDGEKILLRFIDYGNCGSCPKNEILRMKDLFYSQPAFSFGCSLDKIQPLEEEWSSEVCNRLTELTIGHELLLTLVGRKQDGTALVDLVELETGKSLSSILIEEGLVKYVDADISLAATRPAAEKGDVSLEITQPIMESTAMVDDAMTSSYQDYSFGYCDDGHFRCVELNLHSSYDITVCNDELPNAFCVQLKDMEGELATLSEEIQEYVNNNEDIDYSPKIGDACLVKHVDKWQRGLIRMTNGSSHFVFAVDIGWELLAKEENIRSMPRQFLDFPGQAIHCYLAGVVSLEPEWSAEAISFFTDYIGDHDLVINVLESAEDGKYGVSMTTMQDSTSEYAGSSLNQLMIELGHSDIVPGSNIEVQYDMERTLDTDMLNELEESFKEVERNMENKVKACDETDAPTSQVQTFVTTQEEGRMACKETLEAGSKFYQLLQNAKSETEERSLAINVKNSDEAVAFSIASAVDRIDKMGCIDIIPEDGLHFDLISDVDSVLELSKENEEGSTDDQEKKASQKTPQKCEEYCDSSLSRGENKSPLYTWSQSTSPENHVSSAKIDDTGDSIDIEDKIPVRATHDIDNAGDGKRSETSGQTSECLGKMESGPVNRNEGSNTEDKTSNYENNSSFTQEIDSVHGLERHEQLGELVESFEALSIEEEEKLILPYEYYEKLEKRISASAIVDNSGGSCSFTAETDTVQDEQIDLCDSETYNANSEYDSLREYVKVEGLDGVNEDGVLKRKSVDNSVVNGVGYFGKSHVLLDQNFCANPTQTGLEKDYRHGQYNQDLSIGDETSVCDEDASYLTLDKTGFDESVEEERDLIDGDHVSSCDGVSICPVIGSECTESLRENDVSRELIGGDGNITSSLHIESDCVEIPGVSHEITKVLSVGDGAKEISKDECSKLISAMNFEADAVITDTIELLQNKKSKCYEPREDAYDRNLNIKDEKPILCVGNDDQNTLTRDGKEAESVSALSSEENFSNLDGYYGKNLSSYTCTKGKYEITAKGKIANVEGNPNNSNTNRGFEDEMKCDLTDNDKYNGLKDVGYTDVLTAASSDSASVEGSMFESCLEPDLNGMDSSGSRNEREINDQNCYDDATVTSDEENNSVQVTKQDHVIEDITYTNDCTNATSSFVDEEEEGLVASLSTLDDTYDNYESASETFEDTDRTGSHYNSSGYLLVDESTEIESSVDRSGIDSSGCGPDSSSCYDTSSLVFSDSQLDSSYADTSTSTQSTEVSGCSVNDTSATYNDNSTCTFGDSDLTAEESSISSLSLESTSSMIRASSDVKCLEHGESLDVPNSAEIIAIKPCEKGDNRAPGPILFDDKTKNCRSVPDVGDTMAQYESVMADFARPMPVNGQHIGEAGEVKEELKFECTEQCNLVCVQNEEIEAEKMSDGIPLQSLSDGIIKHIMHDRKSKDCDHSGPASFHSADAEEDEVIRGNLEESALTNEEDKDSNMKAQEDKAENASNADKEDGDCAPREDVASQDSVVAEDKGEEQQLDNDNNGDRDILNDKHASVEKDDVDMKNNTDANEMVTNEVEVASIEKVDAGISEDKDESEA